MYNSKLGNKLLIAFITTSIMLILISFIMQATVSAEEYKLCAGATTFTEDGEAIGWYPPNTIVNFVGVTDRYWQTDQNLYILPKEARKVPLGDFLITFYTPSPSENGGYDCTALGQKLTSVLDYAIAVDPRVIPLGSEVFIEGLGWRKALDTGGAIKNNHIDVLTWNIPSYGKCYRKVWFLK